MHDSNEATIVKRRNPVGNQCAGSTRSLRKRDIQRIECALFEAIGKSVGTQPFTGSFAIDWQTHREQPFRRIMRVNIDYRAEGADKSSELQRFGANQKSQRKTVDDVFDLVAAILMAQSQSWLKIPAERLLAAVPETLCFAWDTTEIGASDDTMFMVILSTHEELTNRQILYGVKDYLMQSGMLQGSIKF